MATDNAIYDNSDKMHAEQHRLKQAEKMIALFTKAHERGPSNNKGTSRVP